LIENDVLREYALNILYLLSGRSAMLSTSPADYPRQNPWNAHIANYNELVYCRSIAALDITQKQGERSGLSGHYASPVLLNKQVMQLL